MVTVRGWYENNPKPKPRPVVKWRNLKKMVNSDEAKPAKLNAKQRQDVIDLTEDDDVLQSSSCNIIDDFADDCGSDIESDSDEDSQDEEMVLISPSFSHRQRSPPPHRSNTGEEQAEGEEMEKFPGETFDLDDMVDLSSPVLLDFLSDETLVHPSPASSSAAGVSEAVSDAIKESLDELSWEK